MPDSTTETTTTTTVNTASTLSSTKDTYDETAKKPSVFLSSVRTYVAGVLMPTIAVSVSASFDKSPSATITLPADPRLFNVGYHDRIPVQIFVKETVAESANYILIFEGFVTGKSYLSLATQREINLQCMAYTEVLSDTKLRFMTSLEEIGISTAPGNSALGKHIFVPDFGFPLILFHQGLGLKTEENGGQAKQISSPTEYMANIMQYMEEAGTNHAGCGRFNDSITSIYYATLAYNLKFSKRFCWLPYFDYEVKTTKESDKTGADATSTEEYSSAWNADGVTNTDEESTMFPVMYGLKASLVQEALVGAMQTCSKEFSITDFLKFLVEQIEYEFLIIPNPAFQAKGAGEDEGEAIDKGRLETLESLKDSEGNISGGGPTKDNASPLDEYKPESTEQQLKETVANLQKKYAKDRNCDRMVNFCLKPMFDDTFPPRCNIIFRSQVIQISTNIEYNREPTRIQVKNFNAFGAAILNNGGQENAISLYGTCDFYPSEYFSKKKDEVYGSEGQHPDNGDRALLSERLSREECWTGPWMVQNTAPSWVSYAFAYENGSSGDKIRECELHMRESYMRRQLMRAQILERTLNADCVFLPYITCGFPGVIYDSTDTGFSFAGNVIAYEHQISASGMSTSVVMNGIRLLSEAVQAEAAGMFPNPINCVQAITHNVNALTKVYAAILGTPDATVSGAEPVSWADVMNNYSGAITDVTKSPQTNIYEAYKAQRRNVVTFDDYCSFMGLTKTPSGTDESGNPPTQISNAWMKDRAEITVYQCVPLLQNVRPVEKLKKDKESLEKEIKEEEAAIEKEQNSINDDKAALETEDQQKIAELKAAGCTYEEKDGQWHGTSDGSPEQEAALTSYSNYVNSTYNKKDQKLKDRQEALDSRKTELEKKQSDLKTLEGEIEKDLGKESKQQFSASGAKTNVIELLKEVADSARANNIY